MQEKKIHAFFGNGFFGFVGNPVADAYVVYSQYYKNVILNGNVNYTMIRENIAYAVIFPCVGLGLYVLAGIFHTFLHLKLKKIL